MDCQPAVLFGAKGGIRRRREPRAGSLFTRRGRRPAATCLAAASVCGVIRIRMVLKVTVMALLLTGCASDTGTPLASPSIYPTAISTPTVAPNPSLKPLGRLYLRAARPYNRQLCSFNTRFVGTSPSLPEIKPAVLELAASLHRFVERLRAIDWNDDVQDEISALIAAGSKQETILRDMAAADSEADFYALDARRGDANLEATAAANHVRGALGIESMGGDPCHP
jgi:hypothetical protein